MKVGTVVIAIFLISAQQGFSQGSFVNLNFESPILPLTRDQFFQVPITNALPGWAGYIGGNQVSKVVYDTRALDSAGISLHDSNSVLKPIQGNYSVLLQGDRFSSTSAAIGQTGQIAPSINSLFFLAQNSSLQFSFAGQVIPYFQVNQTSNYTTYAADISSFAGQIGELRFTAPQNAFSFLDGIRLSTTVVPEPNIYSLLGYGVLLFGAARATLKRKQ